MKTFGVQIIEVGKIDVRITEDVLYYAQTCLKIIKEFFE